MSKPKSYREQSGCISCKHCWSKWSPEYTDIYCAKGMAKIPVGFHYPMGDEQDPRVVNISKGWDDDDAFEEVDLWEREHSVKENGICDFYEEEK